MFFLIYLVDQRGFLFNFVYYNIFYGLIGKIRIGRSESKWKIYFDFYEVGNGKIIK